MYNVVACFNVETILRNRPTGSCDIVQRVLLMSTLKQEDPQHVASSPVFHWLLTSMLKQESTIWVILGCDYNFTNYNFNK